MFWKCMRWGGTLIMLVALLAATFLGDQPDEAEMQARPADQGPAPSKNFNL